MSDSRHAALQSMTGYGRATTRTAEGTITAEVRSTNHRYLEVEQRLPNGLAALQAPLTDTVRGYVRRGRVELVVSAHLDRGEQRRVAFDEPLLARYHAALMELKGRFGLKGQVTLDHLLALPQALLVSEERVSTDRLWKPIQDTVAAAMKELVRARRREGAKLTADLLKQVRAIERYVQSVKRQRPKALELQRRHLRQRLHELLGSKRSIATSQLEEVVALVRGADIHEELVRLESHLAHLRQALASQQPVGKQMDFIAQELMRETNTMGAKVDDSGSAQCVVDMKGCIEKIREQVQNLE